ncbi:MAG: hypothetical protein ACTSSA_12630 [Candidatus Freyarchaeota archaeon]
MSAIEEYLSERLEKLKKQAEGVIDDMKNCRIHFIADELPKFIKEQDSFLDDVSKAREIDLISEETLDDLFMEALRAGWSVDGAKINLVHCKCERE